MSGRLIVRWTRAAGRIEVEARPFGDDPLRLLDAIFIRFGEEGKQPRLTIAYRCAVHDRDVSELHPAEDLVFHEEDVGLQRFAGPG